MFSLRTTIIILFILFIPFCLKTCTGIEPFPAILLPTGAETIKRTGSSIFLNSKDIFGLDRNGNWKKIEISRLLYPIPALYSKPLLAKDLGLSIDSSFHKSRRLSVLKKFKLISDDTASANNKRKNMQAWLKEKLVKQQLATTRIKIISSKQTVSTITGLVEKNIVENVRIISLEQ